MARPTLFPLAAQSEWCARVERALGASVDALAAKTLDGVTMAPLVAPAAADGARPLRGESGAWRILARADDPDMDALLSQAREDLAGGADGVDLIFAGSPCAFGFGLAEAAPALAKRFYAEIEPPVGATLELEVPALDRSAIAPFLRAWTESGGAPWAPPSFAFDPAVADVEAVAAAALARSSPIGACFCADGRRVHAAGGSEAQELAFALASGVRALRALESAGASLEDARTLLSFGLAADAEFFLTVAKIRALRLLWARVETACGLEPRPIRIRAETAWRMMVRRDPWTNCLRAGVAACAAALGGADAIAVLPLTQALGLPDAAARRLARNLQLILQQEAHFAKVADPAGGAGAFEALTDQLCLRAWSAFQAIERGGGLAAALAENLAQKDIARARAARQSDAAHRVQTMIGVTEHPDFCEGPMALARAGAVDAPYANLPVIRLAEPFEALRDRSDARLAAAGARPRIFLAGLGPPGQASETLAFAKSLFAIGGFEIFESGGLQNASAVAEAFAAAPARIACICPAPGGPEDLLIAAAQALASAQARLIYLSGAPGGRAAALRKAGVSRFLHSGCDALVILREAQAVEAGG